VIAERFGPDASGFKARFSEVNATTWSRIRDSSMSACATRDSRAQLLVTVSAERQETFA
jgi:hypothetical protein